MTRRSRITPRIGDERGVAYVEFLLAFMPILTLFLGLVQILAVAHARVVVKHAAQRAARSAAVVLDDDPSFYGGEPRGEHSGTRATSADLDGLLLHMESRDGLGRLPTSRRATVELASAAILVALSNTASDTVVSGFESSGRSAAMLDTLSRMELELDVEPRATGIEQPVDVARVRLQYRYRCNVPVVRNLVCGGSERRLEADAEAPVHSSLYAYPSG